MSYIWPAIKDEGSANKAILQGFWAAILRSAFLPIYLISSHTGLSSLLWIGLALADSAFWITLAWSISDRSRLASCTGTLLLALSVFLAWIKGGPYAALSLMILSPLFINSFRGSLAYGHFGDSARKRLHTVIRVSPLPNWFVPHPALSR